MARGTQTDRRTRGTGPFLGGLSLRDLAQRIVHKVQNDNCAGQAAQLAYYLLFAAFPFLLFLTTLLGYVPVPNLMDSIMQCLATLLPGEALDLIRDHVRQLVTNQQGSLLSGGIIVAVWTAASAVVASIDALNRAYAVQEGRPYWQVRGLAILLTIGLSLCIVVSMVLLIFGPQLGNWVASLVGLGDAFQVAWHILRWPIIVLFLMLAMAIMYYFAPDVEQKWKWLSPGSVFAVLMIIVASLGFSFYVSNFGSYNKTYGSIGAVIVLLTWLYLIGFVIVVGGEINAEVEHAALKGKAPGEQTGA